MDLKISCNSFSAPPAHHRALPRPRNAEKKLEKLAEIKYSNYFRGESNNMANIIVCLVLMLIWVLIDLKSLAEEVSPFVIVACWTNYSKLQKDIEALRTKWNTFAKVILALHPTTQMKVLTTVPHQTYGELFASTTATINHVLLHCMKLETAHRVLEVGCGIGDGAKMCLSLMPKSAQLVSTDLSPKMIELARSNVNDRRVDVN